MLSLDVKASIRKFEREVGAEFVRRQLPFATALALTQTAKAVLGDERGEMQSRFDRPRAYTLNSLRAVPATKATLMAQVRVKDAGAGGRSAADYLQSQATGGTRPVKAFETALAEAGGGGRGQALMPTRALPRDATGNVPKGTIGAALRNLKKRGKAGRRGAFEAKPGNKAGLTPGIYQRTARHGVRALFIFAAPPAYTARFPFVQLGTAAANRRFPREFEAALARAIRTGRPL